MSKRITKWETPCRPKTNWKKQKRIILKRSGWIPNAPTCAIISATSILGRSRFLRLSYSTRKHCALIPNLRVRRKISAWPRRARRAFNRAHRHKDLADAAQLIAARRDHLTQFRRTTAAIE